MCEHMAIKIQTYNQIFHIDDVVAISSIRSQRVVKFPLELLGNPLCDFEALSCRCPA
jgi:hypothetical protein